MRNGYKSHNERKCKRNKMKHNILLKSKAIKSIELKGFAPINNRRAAFYFINRPAGCWFGKMCGRSESLPWIRSMWLTHFSRAPNIEILFSNSALKTSDWEACTRQRREKNSSRRNSGIKCDEDHDFFLLQHALLLGLFNYYY